MLRRVTLVRTDVSEELSNSIIRVTRIGELGTLAVTNNRRTLLSSSETSVLTRVIRRNVPEEGNLVAFFEVHIVTYQSVRYVKYRARIRIGVGLIRPGLQPWRIAITGNNLVLAASWILLVNWFWTLFSPFLLLRSLPLSRCFILLRVADGSWKLVSQTKQTNSVALSPQANYTDWSTVTCRRNLVPTFVDRGVSRGKRGGSPAVVNLSFLEQSR
jgi:hypothetical protein